MSSRYHDWNPCCSYACWPICFKDLGFLLNWRTNDDQYTMAADRMNEQVSYLYQLICLSILRWSTMWSKRLTLIKWAERRVVKWLVTELCIPFLSGGSGWVLYVSYICPSARSLMKKLDLLKIQDTLTVLWLNVQQWKEVLELSKEYVNVDWGEQD